MEVQNDNSTVNPALLNRDYTIIGDRSGSMSTPCKNGKSRWEALRESVVALTLETGKFDPDGVTFYLFSNHFKRISNVTFEKVEEIFRTYQPSGSTDLAGVLNDAVFGPEGYFTRKRQGKAQPNGELIIVATDGEPDDQEAVAKVIIQASKQMTNPNELNFTFVQVGNDPKATAYLKSLDDDLEKRGAKYDIVDTLTVDGMGDRNLNEVLVNAVLEHKQH